MSLQFWLEHAKCSCMYSVDHRILPCAVSNCHRVCCCTKQPSQCILFLQFAAVLTNIEALHREQLRCCVGSVACKLHLLAASICAWEGNKGCTVPLTKCSTLQGLVAPAIAVTVLPQMCVCVCVWYVKCYSRTSSKVLPLQTARLPGFRQGPLFPPKPWCSARLAPSAGVCADTLYWFPAMHFARLASAWQGRLWVPAAPQHCTYAQAQHVHVRVHNSLRGLCLVSHS